MLSRSRDQYKWSIVVAMGILVLFIALPTTGHSPKQQATSDASQVSSWQCLKGRDILRNSKGQPRWFSSTELMDRVIEKQPVERPGVLGKNQLRGVVTIQVVIDKNGKVVCTRGVEGHPLGIASAIRSLCGWTFRPYISNGKRKSIVGVLSIPYNFGE
jgi:hypothetical protein